MAISMNDKDIISEANKMYEEFTESNKDLINEYTANWNELQILRTDKNFKSDEIYKRFCILTRYIEHLESNIITNYLVDNGYTIDIKQDLPSWTKSK